MSIQQSATVKRQRLAAELRHIIGPTVCQILPIRVMRKIDRTESLNLNRIVRLQTLEQVECGAVFQPPVIMVADHTMQMLAIERSQQFFRWVSDVQKPISPRIHSSSSGPTKVLI